MSNDVQIPMEDRVRSLERSEAQVLYGRCQGLTHGQIAAKYGKTSDTWSRNLMTSVFEKLGAKKTDSRNKKNEFIKRRVCPVLDEILQGEEANLENWPIYGWVALREGDSVQYREREEHERLHLDIEDSKREPEESALSFEDEDEVDELTPPSGDEVEEVEEQEVPSESPPPASIPVPSSTVAPSLSPEPEREFVWRPPQNQPRNRFWLLASALLCIACIAVAWFATDRFLPLFTASPTSTPTFTVTFTPMDAPTNTPPISLPTETPPVSSTPADTFTPEASQTPEETATSTIPPMPLTSRIREDFSHPYSELWWVSGEPLVTESIMGGLYSGVLTTQEGQTATLLIGNTAWTNYAVSFAAKIWNQTSEGTHLFIGLRVIDLNNMIGLDCESAYLCTWVVIYQGEWDKLPTTEVFYTEQPVTITVDGDTFTAKGFDQYGYKPETAAFVLPPKYKGKFNGGGVMIQLTSVVEIDYVEIDPLP